MKPTKIIEFPIAATPPDPSKPLADCPPDNIIEVEFYRDEYVVTASPLAQ
jgi:hypothetical protein